MRSRAALSCTGQLERLLHGALRRARPSLDLQAANLKLPPALGVRRSQQANADYQTSIALMLGNRFREAPEALAQDAIAGLHEEQDGNTAVVEQAFVSKGGFVNVVLKDAWLAQHVVNMATLGVQPAEYSKEHSKSILVDFCAPNYGKKLHVGHLRSSVIGDTLCNLLEFRGHRVSRISHTGDVGSAFATLIVELIEQKVSLETLSDAQLGQYYESGKKKHANDPAFKAKVDDVVIQLQRIGSSGTRTLDPVVEKTWQRACEVSQAAYAEIFDRLRVNVKERGESTYLPLIPEVINELKARGLAVESRGALCIFVDGPDKPPMLIQKQDGGFLYATVDLACLRSRIFGFPGVDDTQHDEVIYVTDQSQQYHFQHLFHVAQEAGWLSRPSHPKGDVRLTHAWFGLVLGKDGSKLSSRNGAFDYLEDLLNEAGAECQRRSVLANDTRADGGESLSSLNQKIGDAAVRYFDLAQQRERNYKFLFDNVLNLKGNTGVYLMYASARLQGILRRAREQEPALRRVEDWNELLTLADARGLLSEASKDWEPSERALALLLAHFDDEVSATVAQLSPHYLCDYLFRVVGQFHSFYEKCRVLGDAKQDSRLLLCAATHAVLQRGLHLVGLEAIKRM
ncbi:hypothetical protein Poli38472_010738 [Pythium oligandrum]|uniref:arginine--tRNA ligase n=1 Tax=Pythium oligandrum TaxID=41045 RepID=A0A8K1CEE4_PYTOL|nr:hypothetical protein Poli38472_010738 [Pythium oligandrum]|eukprot:TMW61675.1 hypothetical protein Poli38472_010738 [Pythium oligandrum]